jgi:hypothetical protein
VQTRTLGTDLDVSAIGNLSGVSDSVLDALVRALHLDEAERDHLHDVARQANARPRARAPRRPRPPACGRPCTSCSTR